MAASKITPPESLTERQTQFIAVYILSSSLKEALKESGVTQKELTQWLQINPEFGQFLNQIRESLLDLSVIKMKDLVPLALDHLRDILETSQDTKTRLLAIKMILEQAHSWCRLDQYKALLEDRPAQIEIKATSKVIEI